MASFVSLITDKAFDSNAIIADLDERGAKVVIAHHAARRKKPPPVDAETCKRRRLIGNFFRETDRSFAAAVIDSR